MVSWLWKTAFGFEPHCRLIFGQLNLAIVFHFYHLRILRAKLPGVYRVGLIFSFKNLLVFGMKLEWFFWNRTLHRLGLLLSFPKVKR